MTTTQTIIRSKEFAALSRAMSENRGGRVIFHIARNLRKAVLGNNPMSFETYGGDMRVFLYYDKDMGSGWDLMISNVAGVVDKQGTVLYPKELTA